MKLRVSKIAFEKGVHIRHKNYQFLTIEVVRSPCFWRKRLRSRFVLP